LADGWLPGGAADKTGLRGMFGKYRGNLDSTGKPPTGGQVVLGRTVVVGETREEAFRIADGFLLTHYQAYAGRLKHPIISTENAGRLESASDVGQDRFVIGSPDDVIEQLQAYSEEFGVDHIICGLASGGPPHAQVMKQLKLLATEVIPALAE
jgi:alkanesulfonate monooxygenase SsuD/methylene tetrahydromethanopterin reductase-like flavin-dependent oxidoreductase (luciferase family)